MRLSRLTKLLLIIPVVFAVAVIFYLIRGLIIPLIIAFIISFILSPIVNRLERRGIKHTTGVIIIFVCFFCLLILVLTIFMPLIIEELSSFRANLPGYITGITGKLDSLATSLSSEYEFLANMLEGKSLSKIAVEKVSSYAQTMLPKVLVGILPLITYIVIIPFATFFLMKDGRRIKKHIIEMVPNRYFETSLDLISRRILPQ